jgi:putative endonuclease
LPPKSLQIVTKRVPTSAATAVAFAGMSNDLRHRLGRVGEQLAVEHLERRGFAILARNHRTRWGEIDVIAADERRIVFCEVKTRRVGASSPFEGLREAQCRRLRRMAAAWLQEPTDRPRVPELRFDAIGVTIDARGRLVALEHLEGAF